MLERVIVATGGLVGLGSALLFHYAVQHLRLPALLYAIVDLFGALAGSAAVGLIATPIAIGALVLLVDGIFPSRHGSKEP